MTPDEYVLAVVNKYWPQAESPSVINTALSLQPIIEAWTQGYTQAGGFLEGIYYSGSYAKGTAIAGGTDLDLFISLSNQTPETLQEIYNKLEAFLTPYGYQPKKRNVSMRIIHDGVLVDLVPAKKYPGNSTDHSLYRSRAETITKTNIGQHISVVKNSNRITEIKAMKIWRELNGIEFPSFYLELVVIEALSGTNYRNYASNLVRVMNWMEQNIEKRVIVDPSNQSNRVSDDLTQEEKRNLARWATYSKTRPWSQIIW